MHGHGFYRPGKSLRCDSEESIRERNIKGSERRIKKKRRKEEGTLHTSVIATSSSITLNGFEESEGARS